MVALLLTPSQLLTPGTAGCHGGDGIDVTRGAFASEPELVPPEPIGCHKIDQKGSVLPSVAPVLGMIGDASAAWATHSPIARPTSSAILEVRMFFTCWKNAKRPVRGVASQRRVHNACLRIRSGSSDIACEHQQKSVGRRTNSNLVRAKGSAPKGPSSSKMPFGKRPARP
jgi:hypothetical protein